MINVEFENGDEQLFDDLDAVADALVDAVGVSGIRRIYDCDAEGNEIEDGREYGCEWSVRLYALDEDTEQNS
jgi:hypothetical protein